MNGRDHWSVDEPGISKRKKVKMIMDNVKFIRFFHKIADMKTFRTLASLSGLLHTPV